MCLCVYVCRRRGMCTLVLGPVNPEEGARSQEVGVTGGCEPPCRSWEPNSGPPVIPEPCLQPWTLKIFETDEAVWLCVKNCWLQDFKGVLRGHRTKVTRHRTSEKYTGHRKRHAVHIASLPLQSQVFTSRWHSSHLLILFYSTGDQTQDL